MEIQEIEVTIDPSGKAVIHVRGVNGSACLDLTSDLEKVLGNQFISREMTSEAQPGQGSQVSIQPKQKNRI